MRCLEEAGQEAFTGRSGSIPSSPLPAPFRQRTLITILKLRPTVKSVGPDPDPQVQILAPLLIGTE